MRNQGGFITVDFIFAVVLIFGMTMLLFAVSLTLTVASITQYITFASARNYYAGHLDAATQEKRAKAKFASLVGNSVFKPLYKNGWFKLDAEPTVGDITQTMQGYAPSNDDPNLFIGSGVNFTAKILDFKIPFFGSTNPDANGKDDFKTFMGSYLGRDVTTTECLDFVGQRWTAIKNLGNGYATAQGNYVVFADDGC
jgi:hypothetical protein